MPRGEAGISVEGRRKSTEQGDGGLGAALLDALNLVIGHAYTLGQVGNRQAKGGKDVIHGLPEGQCLADRDPLRVLGRSSGRTQRVW
jgi:hypothetical protein